jgi:subtilisin family serine protease
MGPLEMVKLTSLMQRTSGSAEIVIGLIDGPVAINHPDLTGDNIHEILGSLPGMCLQANSTACQHGTFVAGILLARRGSSAPAICPACTLLVRPIFAETTSGNGQMPSATPEDLAVAIVESVNAGARILNLSVALVQSSSKGERELAEALNYAARRNVILVAAAGNQGTVASTIITRHPCVIPVAACDLRGRPIFYSNLGSSIGRRGLSVPGDAVTSLGSDGRPRTWGGTSVAAPFVTGAIALLWSEFPRATATEIRNAVAQTFVLRRTSIVPPLLNAWSAYQVMLRTHMRN